VERPIGVAYVKARPGVQLEQILKRYAEQEIGQAFSTPDNLKFREGQLGKKHYFGPIVLPCDQQFSHVILKEFVITTKHPNNVILLTTGDVVVVENVVKRSEKVLFVGRAFTSLEDFFKTPLESSSLNIVVGKELETTRREFCSTLLFKKCFSYKSHQGRTINLPLIH
jgi:hypothetical protein